MPYEGGDSIKITEACKAVATLQLAPPAEATGTFIGVDLGAVCHVIVIKDLALPGYKDYIPVIIAAHRIKNEVLEEELPKLMKRYGAIYVVSDAMPYTITVEKMAKCNPYRMSICYFGGKKTYSISSDYVSVTANRTNTLDVITDYIPKGEIKVASGLQDYDMIWTHMKNLVKVRAEDEDGTEYYEYVKVGEDHYGFAAGYAMLARLVWHEERPTGGENCGPVNIEGMTCRL